MVLTWCSDDVFVLGATVPWRFGILIPLPGFVATHNVLPCLRGNVGQLVRTQPDNEAVLIVEFEQCVVGLAGNEHQGPGEYRGCPELWAWVFAQWVEEDVV